MTNELCTCGVPITSVESWSVNGGRVVWGCARCNLQRAEKAEKLLAPARALVKLLEDVGDSTRWAGGDETPMGTKVFLLFMGEYEQRYVHSVHSSLEAAKAVDARVRRDWKDAASTPDIEEHELDPALCAVCGYDEDLHRRSDTFTHQFAADTETNS